MKGEIVNRIFKKKVEKSINIPVGDPLGRKPGETGDGDRNLLQAIQGNRLPVRRPGIEMEPEQIPVFVNQTACPCQGAGIARPVHSGGHDGGSLHGPGGFFHWEGLTAGYQFAAGTVIDTIGPKPDPVFPWLIFVHRIHQNAAAGLVLVQHLPGVVFQISQVQLHGVAAGDLVVRNGIVGIGKLICKPLSPGAVCAIFE